YKKMKVFEDAGLKKPQGWSSDEEVALIERETKDGMRPLLVNRNFYAITRWNRSWNYALAVTELAYMLDNKKCDIGQ
ncbi:MAG: lytic murein transglycosylase, partial [Ghiorsea sp.]|nr:lytic murein transglycosylase [Ghiorsea sp.]